MPPKKHIPPLSSENRAFFQQFYEEYKGFLYSLAKHYSSSPADCEDIVQDSILRLLGNVSSIRSLNQGKKAKYIALTVKSAFLDLERRKQVVQEIPTEDSVLEALLEKHAGWDDSLFQLELQELKHSLSARDWFVLEGKYILGYSQEELSEFMDVSPDSIRMILHRARKKARSILLKDDEKGGSSNG